MIQSTDQLNRTILLDNYPEKIISLVPSQTELLFDLGINNEVVGITKFCIHPPEWFNTKTRIGGTKDLHLEKIRELQPDLIIANKEENTKEQIELLSKEFNVWISDISTIEDALFMIREISLLTNKAEEGKMIFMEIKKEFENLKKIEYKIRSCVYLIWKNPWIAAGGGTFISEMLGYAGFTNCLAHINRYPELTNEELNQLNPDLILLSSEPYPFNEKHLKELKGEFPGKNFRIVDGEMFSWYGTRLLKSASYFRKINLDPDFCNS